MPDFAYDKSNKVILGGVYMPLISLIIPVYNVEKYLKIV